MCEAPFFGDKEGAVFVRKAFAYRQTPWLPPWERSDVCRIALPLGNSIRQVERSGKASHTKKQTKTVCFCF